METPASALRWKTSRVTRAGPWRHDPPSRNWEDAQIACCCCNGESLGFFVFVLTALLSHFPDRRATVPETPAFPSVGLGFLFGALRCLQQPALVDRVSGDHKSPDGGITIAKSTRRKRGKSRGDGKIIRFSRHRESDSLWECRLPQTLTAFRPLI
jgi:hypothetical protein